MDFERNVIVVETHEYSSLKTEGSEDDVDVDTDVMAIFQQFEKTATGSFVIESEKEPRKVVNFRFYRCNHHFKQLINWLREKGITAQKPIHSLRKEIGSLICAEAGVYAASSQLRHSSIQITRDHYLDKKEATVVKLGDMMGPVSKVALLFLTTFLS